LTTPVQPELRLRHADAADRAGWDDFVAARPEGDVLQRWAWAEASMSVGERWARLLLVDPDERVRGLAQVQIRRTLLGRSVLYAPHGPLWERGSDGQAAQLDALLAGLADLARAEHGIVVKLDPRGEGDGAAAAAELRRRGLRPVMDYLQAPTTRVVELLDGGEQLMAGWKKEARNAVRRAEREGIATAVHRTPDEGALAGFHGLLRQTAGRGHFRVRPAAFLQRLAAELSASGDWWLVLAEWQGEIVAGAVAPQVGDRAYYLYAGSLRGEGAGRRWAGYAVMGRLMRELAAAGVRTLDLWGVREPGDLTVEASWAGHSMFKLRFGGEPLRQPHMLDLVVDPTWDRLRRARERALGAFSRR
jgi:peptidoglycan pentaglycine glycine transferase (the first glycine)